MKSTSTSFALGRVVATPAALELLEQTGQSTSSLLQRHGRNDWGDVGKGDWRANDAGVESGRRLFSVYRITTHQSIWIITEADRSATTILLPAEY
jgi:hypothetical protein